MSARRLLAAVITGILLASTLATAGCAPEDKAAAVDFFFSWVAEVEGGQAAALWAIARSSSDDPTIDAILKAKKVLDDIDKADKKVEQADQWRDQGDYETAETLLREAIDIRPQDYTYRHKLAALQIETGQSIDALQGYDKSGIEGMPAKQRLALINTGIQEYQDSRRRIRTWPAEKRGPDDSAMHEVDRVFVQRLAVGYQARAELYEQLGMPDRANADWQTAAGYLEYKP